MINLEKHEERKQQVQITLEKLQISEQKAQVVFFIDNSGSMRGLYCNGHVQETFERILPIANVLDDDGKMPVFSFNNTVEYHGNATINNADGFINKNIEVGGGTNYKPIIDKALKYKNDKVPTIVIVITDGDNFDKSETTDVIIKASKENIFFQFIGIGYENFSFLNSIDTMNGRFVDNVGFSKIENLNNLSDKQLYDELMKEFPNWLKEFNSKKPKKKGLFGLLK